MNNNFDLVSVGDATMDVFVTPVDSQTLCQVNDRDCLICFSYGDKIPTKELQFCVGGNAANNVIGVSRLGLKTAIVLSLGDDNTSFLILDDLSKSQVNLDFVTREPGTHSNYNTVINYSGERTIFTYHAPRKYVFPQNLPVVPWYYLTSMGESFVPFYKEFADFIHKNPTIKLAFNPGSWQFRAGTESLKEILSLTYVIFINREEAEKLAGIKVAAGEEKKLLAAVSALGPKMVVITDGGNGSLIFDGTKYIKAGVLPIDAYERTGAGDAFGSGCLSALMKGKSLEEALLWGTLNSASVIGYTGPQKGLLKESEMPVWLDRAKSSGVTVGEF